jgi:hypothetical protein
VASAEENPELSARSVDTGALMSPDAPVELRVPLSAAGARAMLFWLIGMELGLVLLHLVLQYTAPFFPWGPIEGLFDLDEEISIPTWFSTVQLFVIGVVLMLATVCNRQTLWLPNWLLLLGGAAFVLLSADEGAMIHERITSALKRLGQDWLLFRGERGGWILPYLVIGVAGLLIVFRPLSKVVRRYPTESLIAVGGAVMIGVGAVGLEIVSYYFLPEQSGGMRYEVEVAVEEFMEMAGASMILYAVLLLAGRISVPGGR